MTAAAILLLLIVGVGALLYLHHRITTPRSGPLDSPNPESEPDAAGDDAGCCGMHLTCEKDSLVAGMDAELLYYDDEELDAFRGREAGCYTRDEIEMFREVLLTLKPVEIASWARSITARGIAMPTDVRDELLMIVAEARASQTPSIHNN